MYPIPLDYCLLLNLFVICLYLCLFNLIWGCYVPGGTHTMVVLHNGLYCFTVFYNVNTKGKKNIFKYLDVPQVDGKMKYI